MSFAALDCERISVDLALTAARERVPVLERELIEALGKQLAAALAPYANGRDDGVSLFIDRLVIADAIGGQWDPDVIVRKVATRIAAAVSAEIDGGGGLRFRDRIEFVAAFLAALADGSAWSRWWFAEFEGFKAMSASNALRSVVLAEGETGIGALARLTSNSACRVIAAMTPADVTRVLVAFRCRVTAVKADVPELWRRAATLDRGIEADSRSWLAALLACERGAPGSAGEAAVELLVSMRALRAACSADALGTALAEIDLRPAVRALAARHGLATAWLDELAEAELREVLCLAKGASDTQHVTEVWTAHGGLFLLMQLVIRLKWAASWREVLADDEARVLAFTVAIQALAPAHARSLAIDEALLRALDVSDVRGFLVRRRRACERALRVIGGDARPAIRTRRRYQTLVGGRLGAAISCAGEKLLTEFGARLPGLAGSSPDYLRTNLLTLPAAIVAQPTGARVRLGRAPLDVLLTLSGCKSGSCTLPGGRTLELGGDASP